jgi:hypothetical protein
MTGDPEAKVVWKGHMRNNNLYYFDDTETFDISVQALGVTTRGGSQTTTVEEENKSKLENEMLGSDIEDAEEDIDHHEVIEVGYAIFLSYLSGAISTYSKKSNSVALSSTHSETDGLVEA